MEGGVSLFLFFCVVLFGQEDLKANVLLILSGCEDMNIESVWVRRGVDVASPKEYHL